MKKNILSVTPFVVALICIVAYSSSVAPNGTLNEPFFLIPLFWFFTLIGTVGLVVRFYVFSSNNKKILNNK